MSTRPELQIGVSRPPLPLQDLPTPEEVFRVPRIGLRQLVTCVLGPSMIALGVSIGSGEWLLGPLAFGRFGFVGLGWLITLSAVLQTFYNVENARYTLATGEVPIVGFTRTPPGYLAWVPLTLLVIYVGWIWGGWASAAGQSLFPLFAGRPMNPQDPGELEAVRLTAIGLMVASLGLYTIGNKIARTLELIDTVLVFGILGILLCLALTFAPARLWGTMLTSMVVPGHLPRGIDATTLGSIIGYTGFGAGMNFMLINYYRDHGYGMGYRVGFFSGLVGGHRQDVLPSGMTFPESEVNTHRWKRWFRFLLIDQWVVFFVGAMVGMFVPSILAVALARAPGAALPSAANMPVYVATELGRTSAFLLPFMLLLGALILFKTQTTILEMLIRNTVDAANAVSPALRAWIAGDARKAYYLAAVVFIVLIGAIVHLALPTQLLQISANMANMAALIFPLVLIYLNRQLPRPARARWWSNLVLLANVAFFGFFFLNFLSLQLTGQPLVEF
ncbi:MAG: Nramp family divalent metal transporter [Gemmatimonadota bacterium]